MRNLSVMRNAVLSNDMTKWSHQGLKIPSSNSDLISLGDVLSPVVRGQMPVAIAASLFSWSWTRKERRTIFCRNNLSPWVQPDWDK